MNRCHVCGGVAVNADAALCLTCSGKADRGEVIYNPNTGWRTAMHIPATERDTLEAVMRQAESDLADAHAEICNLQGLDPKAHSWPEWSSPANTLRWFTGIRERFGIDSTT